jgi:hypothetical protein
VRKQTAAAGTYKLVCISLYHEDIARLESMVDELKRRGHARANKSQLIRLALDQVDLNRLDPASAPGGRRP